MKINQTSLTVMEGSVIRQPVDAIVNAANEGMRGGSGIDGLIHEMAGKALLKELIQIAPQGTPTGTSVLSHSHDLLNHKNGNQSIRYIIHAVGPRWNGGKKGESVNLASCYFSCLEVVDEHNRTAREEDRIESLAFCSISTGIFGYPLDQAAPIAVKTVAQYLEAHPETSLTSVIFAMWGQGHGKPNDEYREFTKALNALDQQVEPRKIVSVKKPSWGEMKSHKLPDSQKMPTFDTMMRPTVQALKLLGGSGNTNEIYQKVTDILGLSEDVLAILHPDTSQTEVEYRLAWSRTYLKKVGVISNSSRGVWALTKDSIKPEDIDPKEVLQRVREVSRGKSSLQAAPPTEGLVAQATGGVEIQEKPDEDAADELANWHDRLHKVLLGLPPAAFERLAQRLLRESGFTDVEVKGKSNDGGIDGIGIARVSGFLSFRVLFQCKRYQGTISAGQIRDFRGAMIGRTDKGLFITTGTFTKEAVKEATRDGAPQIDLIDGEQLVQSLKDFGLGVTVRIVEAVEVNEVWFANL